MFHLLNFRTPLRSYYLETPPDQAITLSNIYEGVSNTERPWPSGTRTADTREFIFDCVGSDEHGDRRTVLRLSFLDYSGGLLERVEESTDSAFRDLVAKITNASGLLLMIDGYRIRQLINNENKGRLYFQHTIRPLIGLAQRANCPIQFVLTKWDLVRDVEVLRGLDDGTRLRRVVDALMGFEHIKPSSTCTATIRACA